MIFHEIYGDYYHTVTAILREAIKHPVSHKDIGDICKKLGLLETSQFIEEKMKCNGEWPFLDQAGTAVIQHEPEALLTDLQKRWLKTLLSDPRIHLFSPDVSGLEEVEPLYPREAIVYYDQSSDGDPYGDETYIKNFQTLLEAIKTKRKIRLVYVLHHGKEETKVCNPCRLEYSMKDDKFRLIALTRKNMDIYKVSKILSCEILEESNREKRDVIFQNKREAEVLLKDEYQALERAMLQFSSYEKLTERLEDGTYKFLLKYQAEDEAEILIRILSFGPNLKVIGPDPFVEQIKKRIIKQRSCGLE